MRFDNLELAHAYLLQNGYSYWGVQGSVRDYCGVCGTWAAARTHKNGAVHVYFTGSNHPSRPR